LSQGEEDLTGQYDEEVFYVEVSGTVPGLA
jgi:hypothetical protein